jgi:hydrogenase maturation protease
LTPHVEAGRASACHLLIIGYGNPLRGDDAVGYQVAESLGAIAVHQLTPELMEPISRASRVVFIDAAATGIPGTVEERAVLPQPATAFTHHATPEALLAGARALYGSCPPATLITIAGADFELGHPLSAPVQQAASCISGKLVSKWIHYTTT